LLPARLWVTCSQAVAGGFDVTALIDHLPRQEFLDNFSAAAQKKKLL